MVPVYHKKYSNILLDLKYMKVNKILLVTLVFLFIFKSLDAVLLFEYYTLQKQVYYYVILIKPILSYTLSNHKLSIFLKSA